ncbi:hypothetical protein [Flagellimonas onchidii]|uniref:hypothetical protein n=1 Tax=Flagellimonas onchidii TaxID=2562684 RepID=UPI0010A5CC31|nr:hypothetical protein [Allomuricauda onchidii]
MKSELIITTLFEYFTDIRYVALYVNNNLVFKQKGQVTNSSSGKTDEFEELLVNPTLLTLATQRGNIDCGGLNYLIIGYGNFYQLIKSISKGHISICLEKDSDLNKLPSEIFEFLENKFNKLFV